MSAPPIPPRPTRPDPLYDFHNSKGLHLKLANSIPHGRKQNMHSSEIHSKNAVVASAAEHIKIDEMTASMKQMKLDHQENEELSPPSDETLRNCTMANVFFLDYYFDMMMYIHQRKLRLESFRNEIKSLKEDPQFTKNHEEKLWREYCGKERAFLRKRRNRMRISSFHIISQVGQGGYGEVFLAKKKDTSEICALKRMSKKLLSKLGEVNHVLTERDILTRTDNTQWLVKLLYAFQDIDHVYLAMEYVPGGDIRTLLNNYGVLREEHARFYIAEMLMCVSELHRLGYIHRDLKPENFLIDDSGHVKLTDFGLSRGRLSKDCIEALKLKLEKVKNTPFIPRTAMERRSIYRSIRRDEITGYSLVGSPDYMAPEVLNNDGNGYNLSVDYWSLGCILFECLAGNVKFAKNLWH